MKLYYKSKRINSKIFPISFIFLAIFTVNLTGGYYFWRDGHKEIMIIMITGLAFFILGLKVGNIFLKIPKMSDYHMEPYSIACIKQNPKLVKKIYLVAMSLFIFAFLLSASLFLERGIPLLSSNNNAARSGFGVGTNGRIRMLVTWCPMGAYCITILSFFEKKYIKSAVFASALTLLMLIFYSYKGNILWFLMFLYFVIMYLKGRVEIKKAFVFCALSIILMLLVFSVWLSSDYSTAFTYLIKRITQDQVDGLNFIIDSYVPSIGYQYGKHFCKELNNVFFSIYNTSFDMQLAELFYGRVVTWGIVQTLYGFLYIDFGKMGVAAGCLILGFIVKKLQTSLEKIENNGVCGLCLKIHFVYVFIKILLVGNLFNELKGSALSALAFYLVFVFLLKIKIKT